MKKWQLILFYVAAYTLVPVDNKYVPSLQPRLVPHEQLKRSETLSSKKFIKLFPMLSKLSKSFGQRFPVGVLLSFNAQLSFD